VQVNAATFTWSAENVASLLRPVLRQAWQDCSPKLSRSPRKWQFARGRAWDFRVFPDLDLHLRPFEALRIDDEQIIAKCDMVKPELAFFV
jgi:hypothetical protein